MNYYNEIKKELLDNEVNKKIKDYSKNKYELQKYYNVGKLLLEAGNSYGEGIMKEYSAKLTKDIGKKYSVRYLYDIRKLYLFAKVHPLGAQLTMSHYRLLFPLNDDNEINYYIDQIIKRNLSKRQLEEIIKLDEYKRLPKETKNKLITNKESNIIDFVKNPIIIRNHSNYEFISEKVLQKLILEDMESFMKELGNSFCFIGSEYKIKIGDNYHKIDLLLFNIKYNAYVVVELKVTEFKVEYISQVQKYMNYIDKNIKEITNNNTIGILICKKENRFVIEYCSDERIAVREYELV